MNKVYIPFGSDRRCIVINELKCDKPYRINPYPDKTNKDKKKNNNK